ncbi:hypothetical protein AB1N83_007853 [Pleurotus pulmonarius]
MSYILPSSSLTRPWNEFYEALGRFLSVLLFGFLTAQISRYHETFPKDRTALKSVAWSSFILSLVLCIIALLQIATNIPGLFPSYPAGLFDIMAIFLTGFVMLLSQVFFSWRIHQISGKRWIQILVCILSVFQVGGSVGHSAFGPCRPGCISFGEGFSFMWISSNIACDLAITLSMIWFLRRSKGGATFKPTKTMLGKLLTFTLETGLITTGWMALQLILHLALFRDERHFRAYTAFFYPSGPLYSVWLLATLNARSSFNRDTACFVDVTSLPTVPCEIRLRHPTAEGTQVVISIATYGAMSHVESSEVDSDSPRGEGRSKQSEGVLE